MDILRYIAFSFKGIKNSYPVTMSPCCLTLHHIIAFLLHHFILLIWCQGYLKNLQKIIKILQDRLHCIYTQILGRQ